MADISKVHVVVRETLLQEKPLFARATNVVRESLVGDGYGYEAKTVTYGIVRETLLKEAPIVVVASVREALVSRPSEDSTVAHAIASYRQTALMLRPPMPAPSTVRSSIFIASYRELITAAIDMQPMYSSVSAKSMQQQVVMDLPVSPLYSTTAVRGLRALVVQSLAQVYQPISMVYSKSLRSQVVAARDTTPADQVRTAINIVSYVEQVVQSRVYSDVVIQTYAFVLTLRAQVVQQDTRPAPMSMLSAASLHALTVQSFVPPPPGLDNRVGQLYSEVVQQRDITPVIGAEHVAAIRQLAVVEKPQSIPLSTTVVDSMRMLTVMHRVTYPPVFALYRQTASLHQQVLVERSPGPAAKSWNEVAQLRMTFTLERKVPIPIDVIDPAIGRHVASQIMLTVQHRETMPPDQLGRLSRFAHGVYGQVVVGDAFELPPYPEPVHETAVTMVAQQAVQGDIESWEPVSALTAAQIISEVVLSDDEAWVDPNVPVSEAALAGITESVAFGDSTMPDPMSPLSDAVVVQAASALVVGDSTMPDPMLPLSEIEVRRVIENAAVGDADLPDPNIPVSEVAVTRVGASLAVHDASISGYFEGSDITSLSLIESLVIRDPTMKGVPLRGDRRRPVVSVTIS